MNLLKKARINKMSVLFFIVMCLTQVNLNFITNLDKHKNISINFTLIILTCFCIYFFYKLLIKREYVNLPKTCKNILVLLGIITIYFIASTLINFFRDDNFSISITMTSYIALAMLVYIFINYKNINYDDIIKPIYLFFFIINILLISEVFVNGETRSTKILGNINVYISLMLICFPLIRDYSLKGKFDIILKCLIVVSTLIVLLVSGSRFGLISFVIEFLFCEVINHKITKKKCMIFVIILLLLGSCIAIFYNTNETLKKVIQRTFEYPIRLFNLITNTPNDNLPFQPSENSLTREKIYNQSIKIIKNNLFFGTGRPSVFMNNWGLQGAHNYILEILLCYGIIGGTIYIILSLYPIIDLIKNNKCKHLNAIYVFSYGMLFLQSMFEPILSSKIIILLCVYGLAAAIKNSSNQSQDNCNENNKFN